MATSLIGRKLGKYEIVELLGRGGMATVYKAYQQEVDRFVAIKVLPPHPGQDAAFIDRFRLEARTIARLQHPHILPLYDYGDQDDILFLVMAFVSGGSLGERITRGPMPLVEVEIVLRQVASALDYAHRQGVIHRDVKPGNILLDGEGHALLADFGLVRIAEADTNLTASGGILGTPAYMSPEQGQGMPVAPSIDVYALGVVVYEMITGKQPYVAETAMQIVIKHITDPIPDIRAAVGGLPPAIQGVIERALWKDPDQRYQTATEFAREFTRAIHSDDSYPRVEAGMDRLSSTTVGGSDPGRTGTALGSLPSTLPLGPQSQRTQPALPGSGETTIVMQQGTNPLLLLGGFAVIAALMVIVVLIVLSNQNPDSAGPTAVATQTEPTEEAVAVAPTPIPIPSFGRLSYSASTADAIGDAVTLQLEGLVPPTGGRTYVAWLQNTSDGAFVSLGEISLDALGNGVLAYSDSEGRVLPANFNAVLITLQAEATDGPSEDVVYSGSVPPAVSAALSEIFITSPNGFNGGSLLDSAITEAESAANHSGLAQSATNIGGLHTHAEHTINILNGEREQVDYDGNGRADNPGRGIGVYVFLDEIEAKLDAAISAPDAQFTLQRDAEFIRICIANARLWADQVVEIEQTLVTAQDTIAVAADAERAVALANALVNGQDANENGQIEAFEEECGLQQISTFGVLFGSMNIQRGPLPESMRIQPNADALADHEASTDEAADTQENDEAYYATETSAAQLPQATDAALTPIG